MCVPKKTYLVTRPVRWGDSGHNSWNAIALFTLVSMFSSQCSNPAKAPKRSAGRLKIIPKFSAQNWSKMDPLNQPPGRPKWTQNGVSSAKLIQNGCQNGSPHAHNWAGARRKLMQNGSPNAPPKINPKCTAKRPKLIEHGPPHQQKNPEIERPKLVQNGSLDTQNSKMALRPRRGSTFAPATEFLFWRHISTLDATFWRRHHIFAWCA